MTEARRALLPDIDTASIHGSPSDLVQNEVDALRQELTDVKTALKSLMKTVEDLSRVKVEAVSCVSSFCPIAAARFRSAFPLVDLAEAASSPIISLLSTCDEK